MFYRKLIPELRFVTRTAPTEEMIKAAQEASNRAGAASTQAYAKCQELKMEYEAKRDSVQRMILTFEKENENWSVIYLKQE